MELRTNGEMYNPPHPGEIIREEYMKPLGLTVTEMARHLGISRKTVSLIINEHVAVTPETALRLGKALGTSAKLWLGTQQSYDLWKTKRIKKHDLSKIHRIKTALNNLAEV